MSVPGPSSEALVRPITCLNVENHELDIADHVTHYFGCIEICKREEFFLSLDASTQESISTELRRVDYLRRTLEDSGATEESSLVEDQTRIHKKWTAEHKDNIEKIRGIRNRREGPLYEPYKHRALDEYNADKDLKAYMICFEKGKGVSVDNEMCQGSFPNQKLPVHDLLREPESPLRRSDSSPGESRVRYFHLPSNNMKWVQVRAFHLQCHAHD